MVLNRGPVPIGWAIADRSQGTQNVRGRFLQGVSDFADVGLEHGGTGTITPSGRGFSAGFNGNLTPSPNGGPYQNQSWGEEIGRLWHELDVRLEMDQMVFEVIPPAVTVVYIIKL